MIGLKKTKRGDKVLVIDTYIDVDSSVDIQENFFDCVMIKARTEQALSSILYGASPILSQKCSYKPIFVYRTLDDKPRIIDHIIDAYTNDYDSEKVYDIIDNIKRASLHYNIKRELARPTTPNQLFANICRYLLSRNKRVIWHELIEMSSTGFINPIFEHYHAMGLFHLSEMFMFKETMLEYGAFRVHNFHMKQHLCPHCNHSHLLYTECCPKCGKSDLKLENIIHHFSCANVSPETTYNVGGMLICPKCHKLLRHIGVDYDRPAVIYSCKTCGNSFTTPVTKAVCSNCKEEMEVSKLIPHDVVDLEITEEGVRALTQGSVVFSNFVNYYDNYMEFPIILNRIRRQLLENHFSTEYTVLVGKIWILDKERKTIKIKDSLQADFCKEFFNHKVSYNNNIFYVTSSIFQEEVDDEVIITRFRNDLSKGIRKIADKLEPGEKVCYTFMSQKKTHMDNYEEFFENLNYVTAVPDDFCNYSEVPVNKVETPDLTEFKKEDAEPVDKDEKRTALYKRIVSILVFTTGLLVILAALSILLF